MEAAKTRDAELRQCFHTLSCARPPVQGPADPGPPAPRPHLVIPTDLGSTPRDGKWRWWTPLEGKPRRAQETQAGAAGSGASHPTLGHVPSGQSHSMENKAWEGQGLPHSPPPAGCRGTERKETFPVCSLGRGEPAERVRALGAGCSEASVSLPGPSPRPWTSVIRVPEAGLRLSTSRVGHTVARLEPWR